MIGISPPVHRRLQTYLFPLLIFGASLVLYVATAAPWLTWANYGADGGDLIAAAMTWGVPHPPGYPTYCILGRAFALLPLGSIARRFNLFSATMGSAAVAVVYLTAVRTRERTVDRLNWRDGVIALGASLACATGRTFWSQAIIAEVYTLHAFFCALCLYLALRDEPSSWRSGFIMGLVLGLGLGAHLTLVLILPGMVYLLWPRRRGVPLSALAAGSALGLGVYAYLPLAARGDPPVLWGDPRMWGGFWWVVSGKLYHPYVFGVPFRHLPSRLGAWAYLWAREFTWPGVALALWGIWSWVQRGRRNWAAATAIIFASYVLSAIGYDTADSHVYLLPTYLITALWIAEGCRAILDDLSGLKLSPVWIALSLIALAAIPLTSALRNYGRLDLSEDQEVAEWVDAALHELPKGALVVTGEDRHTFTLAYVRWVEGRRQDLLVVDGELLQQPWYVDQVRRRYASLQESEGTLTLEQLVSACLGERGVYLASRRSELERAYEVSRRGVLWKVIRRR